MSNEKQQTAVELFIKQLEEKGDIRETPSIRNIQLNIDTADYIELKIKAKEMEKEQIAKAFDDGDYNYHYSRKTGNDFENGEEYFEELYGGNK
jgi:phage FluMu protein gp41